MSRRVQIAFDLDTNKLKDVYTKATGKTYTSAYKDIENFMISKGYEHRQGSVYHSIKNKTRLRVVRDIKLFQKENLWFQECINRLDYGELNKVHDLLPEIKDGKQLRNEKNVEINPLEKGQENLQNMFQQYNQKHPPVKHKHKGIER